MMAANEHRERVSGWFILISHIRHPTSGGGHNNQMSSYTILFLGDVVGRPGRTAVKEGLPSLQDEFQPTFTIINGENSAGGVGITPDIADELYKQGADAITLGNHAF